MIEMDSLSLYFLLSETAVSGGGAGRFVKAQMRLFI